jgi:hypothetical protein
MQYGTQPYIGEYWIGAKAGALDDAVLDTDFSSVSVPAIIRLFPKQWKRG